MTIGNCKPGDQEQYGHRNDENCSSGAHSVELRGPHGGDAVSRYGAHKGLGTLLQPLFR